MKTSVVRKYFPTVHPPVVNAAIPEHNVYTVNNITGQIWFTGEPQDGGVLNQHSYLTPTKFETLKNRHEVLYVGYSGKVLGTGTLVCEYWIVLPSHNVWI